MTDNTHNENTTQAMDDALGQLLTAGGPRPTPSQAQADRVKAAVLAEWQRTVRQRSQSNKPWILGSMAAALAVVFLTASLWEKIIITTPPDIVASVQVLNGTVYLDDDGTRVMLKTSDSIPAGSRLQVGPDSGVALNLAAGQSIRLRENTELVVIADNQLSLDQGSVYIDSDSADPNLFVAVDTPFGSARDIGTQFMVTVLPSGVQVAVREGQVALTQAATTHSVDLGEQVSLDQSGTLNRSAIDAHGATWDWVTDLTPVYETSGRTLDEFLIWICRENGWTLRYTSKVIELNAQTEELQGVSIRPRDMTAEQALEAVFTGADTTKKYYLTGGVLTVGADQ